MMENPNENTNHEVVDGNSMTKPRDSACKLSNAQGQVEEPDERTPMTSIIPSNPVPKPRVWSPPRLPVYFMGHPRRGHAVIFNNDTFATETGLGKREGTEQDVIALTEVFRWLSLDIKIYNDLTADEMHLKMKKFAKKDHSDVNCFFAAILSHGHDGIIHGKRGSVKVYKLTEDFKGDKCPSLAGKPKIFVVQACRGDEADEAVNLDAGIIEADGPATSHHIAAGSDILYAFSTSPGRKSFRNEITGSWFIQALCRMMKEHADNPDMDFARILTMTSNDVSFNRLTKNDQKKQAPTIETSFTKLLYLTPGASG